MSAANRQELVRPDVWGPGFDLYVGEALDVLVQLPGKSVDSVVTSPPYADARSDYHHVGPDDYPAWFEMIACAIWPKLKDDGSMMLNLGRVFRKGEELDYIERTIRRLRARGWKFIDQIVWVKPNGRPVRPYLTNQHEFVYWLAKNTDCYRGFDEARRPYALETLGRYQRRYLMGVKGEARDEQGRTAHPGGARPGSVFVASVGKAKGNCHPAPMPEELAAHLVALSCPRGGVVLDPFFGSGTTAIAARALGRSCIGIEINNHYAEAAGARLSQAPLLEAS